MEWYYAGVGKLFAFDEGQVVEKHGVYITKCKYAVLQEVPSGDGEKIKFIIGFAEGTLSFLRDFRKEFDLKFLVELFIEGNRPVNNPELMKHVWKETPSLRELVSADDLSKIELSGIKKYAVELASFMRPSVELVDELLSEFMEDSEITAYATLSMWEKVYYTARPHLVR